MRMAVVGGTSSDEKTIGFATNLDYTVMNGQKMIFVVDSPFPAEIAQAAGQSYVRGAMKLYMPKGQTLESMNLSQFRHDAASQPTGPFGKYATLRVYDRLSKALVLSLDFVKFGQYSVSAPARGIVTATVQFEGMLASPGASNT